MPYPEELEYWLEEVSIVFTGMNRAQAQVLALYSYGMALTQRCGQTIVCVFLGLLLGMKSQNVRQRLRELTYEAPQKRGKKRQEISVSRHFGVLGFSRKTNRHSYVVRGAIRTNHLAKPGNRSKRCSS